MQSPWSIKNPNGDDPNEEEILKPSCVPPGQPRGDPLPLMRIEGWCVLGDNIIETIINKSEKIKELKNKAKHQGGQTDKEKKELSEEEKEYKSKRKQIQEKLIKFATRIPAFMYLTDLRENTLQDVITKLELDLFQTVTGLTVKDFHLLVWLEGVQHRADEPCGVRVPPL